MGVTAGSEHGPVALQLPVPVRSNCLFGAISIKRQLGGTLEWQPGWQKAGWRSFLGNPWGHFRVRLGDAIWSYSAFNKSMPVWQQLWFQGYAKRRKCKSSTIEETGEDMLRRLSN